MHVHVRSGDGRAKIDLLSAAVIENKGLKPRDLKRAIDAVVQYNEDFIKAWNEYFDE